MSSPEECSAFFGSCSATPADYVRLAETYVKSHLKMEFHGLLCPWGDANSDRSAHDRGRGEEKTEKSVQLRGMKGLGFDSYGGMRGSVLMAMVVMLLWGR